MCWRVIRGGGQVGGYTGAQRGAEVDGEYEGCQGPEGPVEVDLAGACGVEEVAVRDEGAGEAVQEGGGGDVKVGLVVGQVEGRVGGRGGAWGGVGRCARMSAGRRWG